MQNDNGQLRATVLDAHVGGRIRARRLNVGKSEQAVATALGVTVQELRRYEEGATRVSSAELLILSRVLETSLSFFFNGAPGLEPQLSLVGSLEGLIPKEGEALDLVRVCGRIRDPLIRERTLDLVRTLGLT